MVVAAPGLYRVVSQSGLTVWSSTGLLAKNLGTLKNEEQVIFSEINVFGVTGEVYGKIAEGHQHQGCWIFISWGRDVYAEELKMHENLDQQTPDVVVGAGALNYSNEELEIRQLASDFIQYVNTKGKKTFTSVDFARLCTYAHSPLHDLAFAKQHWDDQTLVNFSEGMTCLNEGEKKTFLQALRQYKNNHGSKRLVCAGENDARNPGQKEKPLVVQKSDQEDAQMPDMAEAGTGAVTVFADTVISPFARLIAGGVNGAYKCNITNDFDEVLYVYSYADGDHFRNWSSYQHTISPGCQEQVNGPNAARGGFLVALRGYYCAVKANNNYTASALVEFGKKHNQPIALTTEERVQRAEWAAQAEAAKALVTARREVAKGLDDLKNSRFFEEVGHQMVAGARDEVGGKATQKVIKDSISNAMDSAAEKNTLLWMMS